MQLTLGVYLQPLRYNSVAWSQAQNGDPLLCVTGDDAQITILNVTLKELVAVCLALNLSL
jgi:polycomb protein EED